MMTARICLRGSWSGGGSAFPHQLLEAGGSDDGMARLVEGDLLPVDRIPGGRHDLFLVLCRSTLVTSDYFPARCWKPHNALAVAAVVIRRQRFDVFSPEIERFTFFCGVARAIVDAGDAGLVPADVI